MSVPLEQGNPAPAFLLPDQNGIIHTLEEFKGSWLILYFYPKDNTSACTTEALAFTAVYEELKNIGVPVAGVSPDSPESHQKFIKKHDLQLLLLSDENHQTLETYGVWKLKKMYGREYMGVERSTFLIDPDGIIRAVWRKVKVKDHVRAVTEKLMTLLRGD